MYIRQECLLPFDEIIKYQPKTRLELILSELDFSNIMKDLSQHHATHDLKGHDELALIYFLVAIDSTKIDAYEKSKPKLCLEYNYKQANW